MFMCAHVYDVALCGNTVRNVAVGFWLVGHPWYRGLKHHILYLSCTCLRIRLNTISGKPGFNSLKTPLNHGAEQASNDSFETNITA